MKVLRVGGVGTGRIFQHAHMRVWAGLPDRGRLVAFHDRDPARAEQARAKYVAMLEEHARTHPEQAQTVGENISQLRCYGSLDELLAHVDLVDICTHARGRMPVAIAAFQRGVHAIAEKPMARVWTEADRASRALAQAPGVLFQLNDDNVFEPKYRAIRAIIDRGEIGRVQSITLIRGSQLSSTSVLKAQADALEGGGGCLLDYGSHGLAGAFSLLGRGHRPTRVEAVQIATLYPHRVIEGEPCLMEVDDNARVKVLMEDVACGAWATIYLEASWCGGHIGRTKEKPSGQSDGYLEIVGDKGVIESHEAGAITVRTSNGGEERIPLIHYPGETVSVLSGVVSFLDAIEASRPSEFGIDFGAEVIAACGAAYLSAIRGKAVAIEEYMDYCREFVKRLGDNEKADDAIVLDLLKPYRRRTP
jgi:myo-inositol 2-dehydrogenase/D-chiro-inositol 1-dehydrogenase